MSIPEWLQNAYLDALKMVKDAGRRGLSQPKLIAQLHDMHRDDARMNHIVLTGLVSSLPKHFGDLLHETVGHRLAWKTKMDEDIADEIDQSTLEAITTQVDMIYETLGIIDELQMQHGHFSRKELVRQLARRAGLTTRMAAEFVRHFLTLHAHMLHNEPEQDNYRLRDAEPTTREQNMTLFRELVTVKSRRRSQK